MKFVPALALAAALAIAGTAYANDAPTTKADCEKAHMTWDDTHGKCMK